MRSPRSKKRIPEIRIEHQERGVIAWRQHPDGYPIGWCESLEAHGGDREKAEAAARARSNEAGSR